MGSSKNPEKKHEIKKKKWNDVFNIDDNEKCFFCAANQHIRMISE